MRDVEVQVEVCFPVYVHVEGEQRRLGGLVRLEWLRVEEWRLIEIWFFDFFCSETTLISTTKKVEKESGGLGGVRIKNKYNKKGKLDNKHYVPT